MIPPAFFLPSAGEQATLAAHTRAGAIGLKPGGIGRGDPRPPPAPCHTRERAPVTLPPPRRLPLLPELPGSSPSQRQLLLTGPLWVLTVVAMAPPSGRGPPLPPSPMTVPCSAVAKSADSPPLASCHASRPPLSPTAPAPKPSMNPGQTATPLCACATQWELGCREVVAVVTASLEAEALALPAGIARFHPYSPHSAAGTIQLIAIRQGRKCQLEVFKAPRLACDAIVTTRAFVISLARVDRFTRCGRPAAAES